MTAAQRIKEWALSDVRKREAAKAAGDYPFVAKATGDWTLPLVMRTYPTDDKGQALFGRESELFLAHGYEPLGMTEDGGHVHAGRLILTGGLSIFAGKRGIRAGGKHTVTWRREAARAPADPDPVGG